MTGTTQAKKREKPDTTVDSGKLSWKDARKQLQGALYEGKPITRKGWERMDADAQKMFLSMMGKVAAEKRAESARPPVPFVAERDPELDALEREAEAEEEDEEEDAGEDPNVPASDRAVTTFDNYPPEMQEKLRAHERDDKRPTSGPTVQAPSPLASRRPPDPAFKPTITDRGEIIKGFKATCGRILAVGDELEGTLQARLGILTADYLYLEYSQSAHVSIDPTTGKQVKSPKQFLDFSELRKRIYSMAEVAEKLEAKSAVSSRSRYNVLKSAVTVAAMQARLIVQGIIQLRVGYVVGDDFVGWDDPGKARHAYQALCGEACQWQPHYKADSLGKRQTEKEGHVKVMPKWAIMAQYKHKVTGEWPKLNDYGRKPAGTDDTDGKGKTTVSLADDTKPEQVFKAVDALLNDMEAGKIDMPENIALRLANALYVVLQGKPRRDEALANTLGDIQAWIVKRMDADGKWTD